MTDQAAPVTVKDLDALIQEFAELETKMDAHAEITKQFNKDHNAKLYRIAAFLKDLNRTEYDSPIGKFSVKEVWRVNMPETDIDKKLLFDHLRGRGIFDKYATVNSNSLNALYRLDWEEAKEKGEGMTFTMPGVPAPKFDTKPEFKPKKVKK